MIRLSAITKHYRMGDEEVRALDGVDLHIGRNEYVALIGPSGSGKSTLMNLIGCLDSPTSGSYVLNGRDTSHMDDNELAKVRLKQGQYAQAESMAARSNAWAGSDEALRAENQRLIEEARAARQ